MLKITAAALIKVIDSCSPCWLHNTPRNMQTFLIMLVTSGLVVLHTAHGQGKCSYAGVVHLEGGARYSLTFQQAQQLCQRSHYLLATEEQLKKAYEQGLKTCRQGWIDGQKVSFLPNTADPNCSLGNAGMFSNSTTPDSLYDVYCFNPPGSSELDCEDTSTSTLSSSNLPTQESIIKTTKPNQDEDVFEEAMADGFIVNIKGTTTHNTVNLQQSTSLTPQEDSVPTVFKFPEGINVNPEVGTKLITENPKEATSKSTTMQTTFSDFGVNEINTPTELITKETSDKTQNTNMEEATSKGTTMRTIFPEFGPNEIVTQAELTTKEITENLIMESSGMLSETLSEKANRHLPFPTAVHSPGRILSNPTPLLLSLEEEAGSGVEAESPSPSELTTQEPVREILNRNLENEFPESEPSTQEPSPVRILPNPTRSSFAEEGTPGWLIIFAFCLTLAAILCVLIGIATKDKWYKQRRRSLDITPRGNTEEYGKTVTLPLMDKEQEMVTLMSSEKGQKNDEDFTIIALEEPPEKEYLM